MCETDESQNNNTADGGYVWPRYVNWYSGAISYNYAVSGAVCSTAITAQKGVGIQEYEIPAFLADQNFKVNGKPFLNIPPNETVYSVWIGTNDLGFYAFLTNNQQPGKTLNDYVDCVFQTFDRIYQAGGRKFVLMNNIPLQFTPLYGLPEAGGLSWSSFWQDKPSNLTAVSNDMKYNVDTTNAAFVNQSASIMQQGQRYSGAQMAIFDTHSLVLSLMHIYRATMLTVNSSRTFTTTQENISMVPRP
jgi:GDSL-like Lipase/Acylhydrolase